MFAILMKSNREVAIIEVNGMTMPAIYVKEEDANRVLYKNDLDTQCTVGPIRAEIYDIEKATKDDTENS